MTKIYIIRHAEAEGNIYRRYQGWYNSLLTRRGERQIAALARKLDGARFDAVYSSDLNRAYQTSDAVSLSRGLSVTIDTRLREISLGEWEDVPFADIMAHDPDMAYNLDFNPWLWNVPGAEAYTTVRERMRAALTEIAERHDGQTVAVFSHGLAMHAFVSSMLGIEDAAHLASLGWHKNTAFSVIHYDSGTFRLLTYSDHSHITPALDHNLPLLHARFTEVSPGDFAIMVDGDERGRLTLDLSSGEAGGAGVITRFAIDDGFRRKGLGIQVLGQAVSVFRNLGRARLQISSEGDGAGFFEKHGFVRAGDAYEMDITPPGLVAPGASAPDANA
ncbi:MAG: GNAT family N-acetyltransferase [Oscillospiraceae bacterium]|nr:GNAT family N-acetyltransferase [Oscillospiraceae bacterium]